VTGALQPRERHHLHQAAGVQARRRRVESRIGGHLAAREQVFRALRRVVDEAAPLKFGEQIVH